MKAFLIIFLIVIIILLGLFVNNNSTEEPNDNEVANNINTIVTSGDESQSGNEITKKEDDGVLNSVEDIDLQNIGGEKYSFIYKDEEYEAIFVRDTWKIYDSYKIINKHDMAIICEALINIHPIPSKDRESFREVEDLVYEWHQHNIAYRFLSDDSAWKESVKDVDLDPDDQGRTLPEMYEARTGKKFDIKNF